MFTILNVVTTCHHANGFSDKLGSAQVFVLAYSNKISIIERFRSLNFFISKYPTKFTTNMGLTCFLSGAINSGVKSIWLNIEENCLVKCLVMLIVAPTNSIWCDSATYYLCWTNHFTSLSFSFYLCKMEKCFSYLFRWVPLQIKGEKVCENSAQEGTVVQYGSFVCVPQ